jgi:P-type Mg2+ transporter
LVLYFSLAYEHELIDKVYIRHTGRDDIISCTVRFWQEYRSNVAAVKLQSSLTTDVSVRRQISANDEALGPSSHASKISIDQKYLVPGDILFINPGDRIPVDCLIIEASHLQVSQSSLTGESEPTRKAAVSQYEKDKSLLELEDIAFMGTSVISGSGLALVLRTGDSGSSSFPHSSRAIGDS